MVHDLIRSADRVALFGKSAVLGSMTTSVFCTLQSARTNLGDHHGRHGRDKGVSIDQGVQCPPCRRVSVSSVKLQVTSHKLPVLDITWKVKLTDIATETTS
jgi:hypothetical protein